MSAVGCAKEALVSAPERVLSATGKQASAPPREPSGSPTNAGGDTPRAGVEFAQATFDYATLRDLEAAGFGFETLALGQDAKSTAPRSKRPTNNAALQADPGYASIVQIISRDLDELRRADRAAGVGMAFAHRAFDKRWLTSSKFFYELVAVVHRVDRRVFESGTCGELRFVYRLAYDSEIEGKRAASRVPMTVNVVRWINDDGCQRWIAAMARVEASSAGSAASEWLGVGRPLDPAVFALTSPKAVEINLQSVRWPSTVRPNMAGHAEYLMRVFRRDGKAGRFDVAALENTPDVARLKRDVGLQARLTTWLRAPEQQTAIALGVVEIPDEFLATRAISVAPHGLARQANRPFTATLGPSWGESPEAQATLRRLDVLSCPGCHQSRSVAGFHVLGSEAEAKRWDVLAVPHSPHVTEDMPRRSAYVAALAHGGVPDDYRPPAERPREHGGWGSRCGLEPVSGGPFEHWTCAEGLVCRAVDDPKVGECLPAQLQTGDACEPGVTTWNVAARDFTRLASPGSCGELGVCERNAVGFPGGMCSASCSGLPSDNSVCGQIAMLDSFNACLARGELFERCLATATRPGALRRCSRDQPCRDDYVCAGTASGAGGCLPPYFLFQLRVDGHLW